MYVIIFIHFMILTRIQQWMRRLKLPNTNFQRLFKTCDINFFVNLPTEMKDCPSAKNFVF